MSRFVRQETNNSGELNYSFPIPTYQHKPNNGFNEAVLMTSGAAEETFLSFSQVPVGVSGKLGGVEHSEDYQPSVLSDGWDLCCVQEYKTFTFTLRA